MTHLVTCDNIDEVLLKIGRGLSEIGTVGNDTTFLSNVLISLQYPRRRWLVNPGRKHNIIAQIAETMWVLAGRNDMLFLTRFLPRAPTWSDDGYHWRAGYGMRLRQFGDPDPVLNQTVDQLFSTYWLLRDEPTTRRAIVSLWDPMKDAYSETKDSKDYPCNTTLDFKIVAGMLNCTVYNRSNDLIWGLTGVNIVEFTILQELMAEWLGIRVGEYCHFSSNVHVYPNMNSRLDDCLEKDEEIERFNAFHAFDTDKFKLRNPGIDHTVQLLEELCETDVFYGEDPIAARKKIGELRTEWKEYPEIFSLFVLPLVYKRPEMLDFVDNTCLPEVIKFNLQTFNPLKIPRGS